MFKGMPIERARAICKAVTIDDLHQNCVFDVATTGDETFAEGYLFAQELRSSAPASSARAVRDPFVRIGCRSTLRRKSRRNPRDTR